MRKRWKLRWARFLLTLGLRHLLRLTNVQRAMLRRLPLPGEETDNLTYPLPRELTRVRVPLVLKRETALEMRRCLEDQVILLERIAQRMRDLIGMVSTSLRKGSRNTESR